SVPQFHSSKAPKFQSSKVQVLSSEFSVLSSSTYTEQHVHCQLIEALVRKAFSCNRGTIEVCREERVPPGQGRRTALVREQRLNFRIVIPPLRAVAQDEIGPHAPARELLHPADVLRAVRVRVEVPRPVVADILE